MATSVSATAGVATSNSESSSDNPVVSVGTMIPPRVPSSITGHPALWTPKAIEWELTVIVPEAGTYNVMSVTAAV